MKEMLNTSKFWQTVGTVLSLVGIAVATVASDLSSKEMESRIADKVANTLNGKTEIKES